MTAVLVLLALARNAQGQTPIGFGETKVNQQQAAGQDTIFSFKGTAGQLISIQMAQVSGDFFPTFDVLSPNGTTLKTVTDRSGLRSARLPVYALPVSGTFLIDCRDGDGRWSGAYNLTLVDRLGENPSDNEKGALSSGKIKSGSLVATDIDIYTISGQAGDLLTIQMIQASGDFFPTFDVLSPTGDVLQTATDRTGLRSARLTRYALPTSGEIRIVCRDGDGRWVGGYNLSATVLRLWDQDNDGLPDAWETQYFSDLRYNADDDPDNDRLKNVDELAKNTDPSKADTDGDGFKDGIEVGLGSNPTDPNSKPVSGLNLVVRTVDLELVTLSGYRYQLKASRDHQTWQNLGEPIQGDNSLFRTNIDVRGTDFRFFIAPATATP